MSKSAIGSGAFCAPDGNTLVFAGLNQATTPQALNLPGYRLHPLKGGLHGFWSVTVRANWRIIFRFEGEDAFDVELIDYH